MANGSACTRIVVAAAWVLFAALCEAAQYSYDALGRLKTVTEADGSTIQYSYDANGNVVSIVRTSAGVSTGITAFSPSTGPAGTLVTIVGQGFSAVAAQNTVLFNGTTATVVTASPNVIRAQVPVGATSGVVTVTTPIGSATSGGVFTVNPVSITSFAPTIGAAGTPVTISGGGFSSTPANNAVVFHQTAATVVSATGVEIQTTVPSGATTGRISITTPNGAITSAADFIVPATGYTASQIATYGRLISGGVGRIYTINSTSRVGVAFFDASAGERISFVMTNVTMRGQWRLYAPDGSLFDSSNITDNLVVDLPALAATGTYSLYFVPSSAAGSATVRVVSQLNLIASTNGTALPLALLPGQNAEVSFAATAGRVYLIQGLQFSSAPTGGLASLRVLRPDSTTFKSCPALSASPADNCLFYPTVSATYRLRVDPASVDAVNVSMRVKEDIALTAGAAPTALNLATPGESGLYSVVAAGGETVAPHVSDVTMVPNGTLFSLRVYDPAGTSLAAPSDTTLATVNLPSLAAGRYAMLVAPLNGALATLQGQVRLAQGVTGALNVNGVGANLASIVPGQYGYFTFTGTAGQNVGIGITNVSLAPTSPTTLTVAVRSPSDTAVASKACSTADLPGCILTLPNLAASGTYSVIASAGDTQSSSYRLTLSNAVAGTLPLSTNTPVNLTSAGQFASLTFNAAAGDARILNLTSIATTPASSPVTARVFGPTNIQIATATSSTSTLAINLTGLVAGTHRVQITADRAATATMQARLDPALIAPLLPNGTTNNYATTVAGQKGYFTFNATAGDNFGLGITSIVLSPTTGSQTLSIVVKRPDGTNLQSVSCTNVNTTPDCQVPLRNLPVGGTYTVEVSPAATSTMSFGLTFSPSVTAALPADSTLNVAFASRGQNAVLSFTATTGQAFALDVNSLVTTPAGRPLDVKIYKPSGTLEASYVSSNARVVTNLVWLAAGTYTVLITAPQASLATMQVTLRTAPGAALALNATSALVSSLAPGQAGNLTFAASAGQDLSLSLNNAVLTPATPGSYSVAVRNPSGTQIGSRSCGTGLANCTISLPRIASTGTHSVSITPGTTQTFTLTATLTAALTATITPAAPITLSPTLPGQAGRVSFASTGAPVSFHLNPVATSPAGRAIDRTLFDPSFAIVGSTISLAAVSQSWKYRNLAVGNYSVFVAPKDSASATLPMRMVVDQTGTLATNGAVAAFTSTTLGQSYYLTFPLTVGQTPSIGITNIVLSPATPASVAYEVLLPSGSTLQSGTCPVVSPNGCTITLGRIATAGTYTLRLDPASNQTLGFNAALVPNATGALTLGVTQAVSVAAGGQQAALTFTLPATQTIVLTVNSIATTPTGRSVVVRILRSTTGSQISTDTNATSISRTVTSLAAGTYVVLIYQPEAAVATMQVRIQ